MRTIEIVIMYMVGIFISNFLVNPSEYCAYNLVPGPLIEIEIIYLFSEVITDRIGPFPEVVIS